MHHEIEECWASLRQFLGQACSVSVTDVFQLVGSQVAAIPRGSISTVKCLVRAVTVVVVALSTWAVILLLLAVDA